MPVYEVMPGRYHGKNREHKPGTRLVLTPREGDSLVGVKLVKISDDDQVDEPKAKASSSTDDKADEPKAKASSSTKSGK